MIKILPLHDNETLAELNRKHGTSSRLAYCLYSDEKIEGCILYGMIDRECARIDAVDARDDGEADGLVRAVFSSLYDFGLVSAQFSENIDNGMLARLNFVNKGEYYTKSLEDVLYNCKNCSHN